MAEKSDWRVIREAVQGLGKSVSPDARWGTVSLLASVLATFVSLMFAFWAIWISLDGSISYPTKAESWVFAALTLAALIASLLVARYTLRVVVPWYLESLKADDTSKQLGDMRTELTVLKADLGSKLDRLSEEIHSLVAEIRRDRDERNKRDSSQS